MNKFNLKKSIIGGQSKVYFIADIAANHDGSLQRALKLIELAKKSIDKSKSTQIRSILGGLVIQESDDNPIDENMVIILSLEFDSPLASYGRINL